jgi:hypothetical protein
MIDIGLVCGGGRQFACELTLKTYVLHALEFPNWKNVLIVMFFACLLFNFEFIPKIQRGTGFLLHTGFHGRSLQ